MGVMTNMMVGQMAGQAIRNTSTSANSNAANSNAANSTFLERNGVYLGLFLSVVYIGASIFMIYSMMMENQKIKNGTIKNGKLYEYEYIIPILFILLGVGNITYWSKNKDNDNKKDLNSNVANIALLPMYIVIVVGFFSMLALMK